MDFLINDRQSLDAEQWDRLASERSFFQTTQWADVCAAGMDGPAYLEFLCGYSGDKLIAAIPALIYRKLGLRSFISMPNGTYGGALFADGIGKSAREDFFSKLIEYLKSRRYSRVMINDFSGSLSDWQPSGFTRERHFTHIIELDTRGEYIPNNRNVVKNLRAAEKAGGEIVRVNSVAQIGHFFDIYLATENRHGRKKPLYSRNFFESVGSILGESNKLYWTALEVEAKMIGSQISFLHGDTLFYWQAVSDYEMRKFKPNYRLLYEAIKFGVGQGAIKINLGASPPEAEGLIYFKECWGGRKIEYDSLNFKSTVRKILGR